MNNYHMHTTFCDGANTPEEMAEAALKAGCEEVGFSGHSYLDFDPDWNMDPETTNAYRQCIDDLKDRYAGRLSIRLGIEQDYCSDPTGLEMFEYVIGGVHCIFKDGHYISVDLDAKEQRKGIEQWYGGDQYAFVEDYYQTVAKLYDKTHCNIIAHFDLVTKFIEQDPFIDPSDPRYMRAADDALDVLLEQPVAFEINTGAISRGYRTTPYPDERILARLSEAQTPVILSSDAHRASDILFGFDMAMDLVNKYDLNLYRELDSLLDWEESHS